MSQATVVMSQKKRKRTGSFIGKPAMAGSFGRTRGRSYRKAPWRKTRRSANSKNEALANLLGDFMETKTFPCTPTNQQAASPIQTLAKPYTVKYVLGNGVPSTYSSPHWTAVEGLAIGQGDGRNQRIGQSVYLKHTKGTVTIDMPVMDPSVSRPMEFRMIAFRKRQRGAPTGVSPDPDQALFHDISGNEIGDFTGGIRGIDLMNLPVNRDNFTVFMDKRFTLGPDGALDSSGPAPVWKAPSNYPSTVTIPFTFNHERKVTWFDGGIDPSDYDGRFNIVIYASSVGRVESSQGWTVDLRASTEFLDP